MTPHDEAVEAALAAQYLALDRGANGEEALRLAIAAYEAARAKHGWRLTKIVWRERPPLDLSEEIEAHAPPGVPMTEREVEAVALSVTAPKLNRDGRLVVAITVVSLLANLAMFIAVMCCWKGCAPP